MDLKTIELSAAILFALIAVVGGGFVVKEIQIPRVPAWARFVSGALGLVFLGLFLGPFKEGTPSSYRYIWQGSDRSKHGFMLLELSAKAPHDPPRVGDAIEVAFQLKNVAEQPLAVAATFIVGRDPDGNNRDFGSSNEDREVQPGEILQTTGAAVVDVPGVWIFGPSYDLGNETYPGEWHRFSVPVEQ